MTLGGRMKSGGCQAMQGGALLASLVALAATTSCLAQEAGREALRRLAETYRGITGADISYDASTSSGEHIERRAIVAADGRFAQIFTRAVVAPNAAGREKPQLIGFQYYDLDRLYERAGPQMNFTTTKVGPDLQAPAGPLQLLDAPWPIVSSWADAMLADETLQPALRDGSWTAVDETRGRTLWWDSSNRLLGVEIVLRPSGNSIYRRFADFDEGSPIALPRTVEAVTVRASGNSDQPVQTRAEYRTKSARLNPTDIETLLTFDRQAFPEVGEIDAAGNVYGASGELLYNEHDVVNSLRGSRSSWLRRWWPVGVALAVVLSAWVAWRKLRANT